ncbi:MAG: LacI family DNA-binding transcriptional regulator [Chthonomonadales bacterium]|nr:LacI family DNA-binding transcriptional regulator [Chthonomonadales bacterium]
MPGSMPARDPRTTLTQVAERAGVSLTTASLVLGGKADQHRISSDTLQRVLRAAEELDYAPNLLVKSLRHGHTNILAFLSAFRHRHASDLYMDRLSTSIEMAVGRHGYNVLVYCNHALGAEETYRFLNGGHTDGLLFFAPLPDDPLLPYVRQSRQTTVLINARDDAGVLPCARDDVESGMCQVAHALLSLGHRRIVALGEEGRAFRDSAERIALLERHLCEAAPVGLEFATASLRGSAESLLRDLMGGARPPTALFCWRDRMAYWFLEACESLGIDVPGRLSIVGYDGLHWPAATRHVAASVRVDLDALAEAAVGLLDGLIHRRHGAPDEARVPVVLSPGTTLGPASGP